ncbi:MAG: Crp/Fnr family transcriptional regulator [Cyanobacteriota bacterium]|nr:Crp/Fnr family transcriptional regulator [Cyanobacteriota bacterium]
MYINQLLTALPASAYSRLAPHLQTCTLDSGQIIYEANETIEFAYFPNRAMISLVSIMEDGATTEIGLIGNEGMVGLPIILGSPRSSSRAIVQVAGDSMKIGAKILQEEFKTSEELRHLLLLYTQAFLTQVSQTAACNRQHNIEERLARWLLSVHDCILEDELPLTQEFVANMLGVRRSGVTIAANTLQKAGIIQYRRGRITILNHQALEATSCECYKLVQSEFIRLLGFRRG